MNPNICWKNITLNFSLMSSYTTLMRGFFGNKNFKIFFPDKAAFSFKILEIKLYNPYLGPELGRGLQVIAGITVPQ